MPRHGSGNRNGKACAKAVNMSWELDAVVRLLAAAGLGAIIGAEREYHGRSAGFRTQLLVCLGSALAMVVSLNFAQFYGNWPTQAIRVDPARVAYGVMGGIGFLGAGTIIVSGAGIRGLTTAASLWCTAAVGLACGFGMFLIAAATAAIVLFALMVLYRIDAVIPVHWAKTVTVTLPADGRNLARLTEALQKRHARILSVDYRWQQETRMETITFHLNLPARVRMPHLADLGQDVPEIVRLAIH